MRKYRLVAKKGEGTFSEVLKAQNVKDGKYHAIKCMKNHFDSIDQVNNLREIQALRRLSPHAHIITLEEVLYDQPTGRLALVFELMDANLYELIRGRRHYLNAQLVRSYMYQLLKSLDHMHRKGIFHRDIKPENILIENTSELGQGLKLADFGSCRGIYSKQPYTEYISTRWYRAAECLLTDGYYGPEMDLWGAGCVFFEVTSLYPLFPGTNELDQINRIHKVLGTPEPEVLAKFKQNGAAHVNFDFPPQKGIGLAQLIPHASPDCVDLMMKMLAYDASERITAREALRHPYFREMRELEARRAQAMRPAMPTHAPGGSKRRDGDSSYNNDDGGAEQSSRSHKPKRSNRRHEAEAAAAAASDEPKALPNISGGPGGNYGSVQSGASAHHSSTKKSSKPMPSGSLARSINQAKTQYSSNDHHSHSKHGHSSTHGASGESEGLPPIMGVTGHSSTKGGGSNQPYKYKSAVEKSTQKRKKKSGKTFETKHSYSSLGTYSQGVSKTYTGMSSQSKSSNHLSFQSQSKGGKSSKKQGNSKYGYHGFTNLSSNDHGSVRATTLL